MTDEEIHLNPFIYISETDIRFYLTVIIGVLVPFFWAWLVVLMISSLVGEFEITMSLRILVMIPLIIIIPLLIYWQFSKFPEKIVKESRLRELDEKKFPEESEYIKQLATVFPPTVNRPELMYNPLDPSVSAFTFGTWKKTFIGIPGGVLRTFRKNIDGFRSIILHEFGHIVNRDVEKTYLAESTWRSLLITIPISLIILLCDILYTTSGIFYYGIRAGFSITDLMSMTKIGDILAIYSGILLYLLIFMGIVYLLRNQIIRLREFYADARVLAWEGPSGGLVKTLEGLGEEPASRFDILTKFHPLISERIQVLKDNRELFTPSLWVGLSIGFFYGIMDLELPGFLRLLTLTSQEWGFMKTANYQPATEIFIVPRAAISLLFFTFLFLAVSSSFHRWTVWAFFRKGTRILSARTLLTVLLFSLAFSLGWLTDYFIGYLEWISVYGIDVLFTDLPSISDAWIKHALYFALSVIYLIIFASMFLQRSFSRKEADRYFLYVSVAASTLYLLNRFLFIEVYHNKPMVLVSFLIFSLVTYIIIKFNDRDLVCPNCRNKQLIQPEPQFNCKMCGNALYSWVISSHSPGTVD